MGLRLLEGQWPQGFVVEIMRHMRIDRSAGAMQAFPVVDAISELTFLEENDNTIQRASHRAKVACTKRYLKAGKPVNVVTPRIGLTDFNDVWREAQQQ